MLVGSEQAEVLDLQGELVPTPSSVPAQTVKSDQGQFTDLHAFSPARPAPPKHSMISTTTGALSKLIQPKLNLKPVQKDFH